MRKDQGNANAAIELPKPVIYFKSLAFLHKGNWYRYVLYENYKQK